MLIIARRLCCCSCVVAGCTGRGGAPTRRTAGVRRSRAPSHGARRRTVLPGPAPRTHHTLHCRLRACRVLAALRLPLVARDQARVRGAPRADTLRRRTARPEEVVYSCLYTNRPDHSRAHQRWQDGLLIVTGGSTCACARAHARTREACGAHGTHAHARTHTHTRRAPCVTNGRECLVNGQSVCRKWVDAK